jgi:hypothetical protein
MFMSNALKLTVIERRETKALADAALAALQAVAEKYGVTVKYAGGSYSGTNCTVKFEFSTMAEDGTVMDRHASDFKRYAQLYGLPADALGKVITHNGEQYTITGLTQRGGKFPVTVNRVRDGRGFKLSLDGVKRGLGIPNYVAPEKEGKSE